MKSSAAHRSVAPKNTGTFQDFSRDRPCKTVPHQDHSKNSQYQSPAGWNMQISSQYPPTSAGRKYHSSAKTGTRLAHANKSHYRYRGPAMVLVRWKSSAITSHTKSPENTTKTSPPARSAKQKTRLRYTRDPRIFPAHETKSYARGYKIRRGKKE